MVLLTHRSCFLWAAPEFDLLRILQVLDLNVMNSGSQSNQRKWMGLSITADKPPYNLPGIIIVHNVFAHPNCLISVS